MGKTEKTGFFYGWVIVATGFSVSAIFGGGLFYSYGVFFPVMLEDLGFSRGAGATAVSIMILMQAINGPTGGLLVSRIGLKKVMVFGNLLLVATMILMSRVTAVWHIYLIYGILASTAIMTSGLIPIFTMVNNWFSRYRSRMMSICIAGVGVGTLILAPLSRYLIEAIGWRQAWLTLAGIAVVFALLPAIFLAKERPEDMGQTVDGAKTHDETAKKSSSRVYTSPIDWEIKDTLKTAAFWIIALIGATNMFSLSMLSTHQVAHLEDIGISPIVAAGATGLLVGISILGRLAGGFLGDRFELRYVAAFACAFQVIALLIFTNTRALPLIYIYVVIFGIAYGTLLSIFPAIIGSYYGRKNFSAIFGIGTGVITLVGATGPAFAGFAFDASGSYFIPLTVAAILVGIGCIAALLGRPPRIMIVDS